MIHLKMVLNENNPLTNFEIPKEWIYRGEGNCNVVLALPRLRKILRIRKTERPKSLIGWLLIWISDFFYWYSGKGFKDELRDLQFYSAIMRPLVGRKYTSEAHQVFLTRKQIKILEEELGKFRPEFRKNKVLQYGRAALFDDFAFVPLDEYEYLPLTLSQDTFAIEIKPKQGWRPLSEKFYPSCLFCMNQYLKVEKRKFKEHSRYCPEDLFSGNERRMRNAIQALIEVPQNNFRIFKNGILVYGEKMSKDFYMILEELFLTNGKLERLTQEFCELIQNCLLTNLINIDLSEHCEEKLFCEWNKIIQSSNGNNCLPKGCVLEKIFSIQMLDAEGCSYYSKLLHKEEVKDWDYIDLLLDKVSNESVCMKCLIMMLGDTNRCREEKDLAFVPYLISAIAKDCSLMVTLKKVTDDISDNLEMKNIIKTNYGHFLVNIGVFDLYPKPLSTINKHCKRNEEILQAFSGATSK